MTEPVTVPVTEPVTVPAGPVDVHGHAMPLPVLQWLADVGRADLARAEERVVVLDSEVSGVASGAPIPLAASMTDPALRVSELDGLGIAAQAVSLPPFLMASCSRDEQLVTELVRRGNDALAAYSRHDARLLPLGLVPLGFDGAAAEALRCLDDLGMTGIAIGSRGAAADLDATVNDALWEVLAQRRTFVLLHPSAVPDPARVADFWFPQLLGYPLETAIAAGRLIFSGTLDRHPLTLCLAHGGGCLPALRGRLDMGWSRKPQARTIERRPSSVLRTLFYDTAVFDPQLLARLVEDVGASQVLLGTDHPFDLAETDPIGLLDAARLLPEDRYAVAEGNARRLLGIV